MKYLCCPPQERRRRRRASISFIPLVRKEKIVFNFVFLSFPLLFPKKDITRARIKSRQNLEESKKKILHARNIAAKNLSLGPVHHDEYPVASAKAHAEVGRAPENIGNGAARGNVSRKPRNVGNGLLRANVGERALVRVLKRTNRLDPPQPLLQRLDLAKDLVTGLLAGCLFLLDRQLRELLFNLGRLGHVVEHAREESTLLGSNLGSGSVVGDGAIADCPDVLGALDNQVLVDGETAARVLLGGDLVDEVLDNGAESVAGGPDEKTIGDALELLLAVGTRGLGLNVLVRDILDHGLCANVNRLLLERLLRVVNELLGEHGQDVGQRLDQRHLEVVLDLWQPLLQVRVEKVLQFTGEFDTGRTATDDDHVKQALLLLLRLVLERGRLAAVHDAVADTLGIADLFQEEAVLPDTRDT